MKEQREREIEDLSRSTEMEFTQVDNQRMEIKALEVEKAKMIEENIHLLQENQRMGSELAEI